jgi:plastocyanin
MLLAGIDMPEGPDHCQRHIPGEIRSGNGAEMSVASAPARRRLCLVLVLAMIAWLCAAATGAEPSLAATAAAVAKVSITDQGFSPAVAVVPIGTTVRWTNNGKLTHSLSGQVHSPGSIKPGGTYQRKFTAAGEYQYYDGTHPDSVGTVVVTAGAGKLPSVKGIVTHYYKATMNFDVIESWTYYDPAVGSTTGTCNPEVGSGSRDEHLTVNFSDLVYSRYPSAHVEGLYAAKYAAAKFSSFHVQVTMKYAADTEPMITCPGGETGFAPTTPDNCSANYTGQKVLLSLIWGPNTTDDRILFDNYGPAIKQGDCAGANQILGALVLVGVKGPYPLPLNVVGYQVNYDEAATAQVTPADVAALRAGRAFTVNFSVTLHFTTPCCDGFDTPEGLPAVIGAIHSYTASLSIHFTPRT